MKQTLGLTVGFFFGLFFTKAAGATPVSFPVGMHAGGGVAGNAYVASESVAGGEAGASEGQWGKVEVGYLCAARSAYREFLQTGHPLPVREVPVRAGGDRYVTSQDRSIRLAWSSGKNQIPVRYRLFFGEGPAALKQTAILDARSFDLRDLIYMTPYFWHVEAFDRFGRSTPSSVFSFVLVPGVAKMICAPNPFRAGRESTTFIFNMPGEGSAELSIYLLPHETLVFQANLHGLTDGTNTYTYRGEDGRGRTLFNGVYAAVLKMEGSKGRVKEDFIFVVAK